MSRLLSSLMSFAKRGAEAPIDYDTAKRDASHADVRVRRALAGRVNVQPEILYFLAEDSDPAVRREIAANPVTPIQADALLAADGDEGVRCILAEKIARLAPGLTDEQRQKAGQIVTGILETLAQDQAVKVRRILAEELKGVRNVPASVVERLAQDREASVSVPVLSQSPLLSDRFLVEVIASRPVRQALEAIAGRAEVGPDVADAIVAADERDTITTLLRNSGAQIREETLDRLVDAAADIKEWHAPLVARPSLSAHAAKTLSRFVADTLIEALLDRGDLDPAVIQSVGENVRRRLGSALPDGAEDRETAEEKVLRLHAAGALTEDEIRSATLRGERSFVIESLAVLGGLRAAVVQKAFNLGTAKGVAAVAWRAGLSADLAHQLQLRLARVAPADALKPSGGGFALSEKDLTWQLEFLGA